MNKEINISIFNYIIKMDNLVAKLINLRLNNRHPSEPSTHASAVIKDRKKSCPQCNYLRV